MVSATLTEADKERYIPIIDKIFYMSDLQRVSVKKVRTGLQTELGIDLLAQKKEVDALITARFDKILAEQNGVAEAADENAAEAAEENPSEAAEDDDDSVAVKDVTDDSASPVNRKKRKSSSLDADAKLAAELHAQLNGGRASRTRKGKPAKPGKSGKPAAKGAKRAKKSKDVVESSDEDGDGKREKKKRKGNPNSPFMRPLMLSEPLALLVGETQLSRPECVKRIWEHIKAHDLQDPNDKRQILCDERMKTVFGPKVHMFTMNKVLSEHMYKPDEISSPGGGGAASSPLTA